MSKSINTTSIGLFIILGLALGLAGLVLFSSSKMFGKTREVIVYFDESLNGLSEGAPVKFRGVTIGSVKRVMVRFNQASNDFAMPVILEVEEKLVRERLGDEADIVFIKATTEDRIRAGLRASLQTESLVTGVLYVDVRINPGAPPPVYHQLQKIYPELPTEPTQIQKLFNNLASLDIKSVESNLNALLIKLDTTVAALHMEEINLGVTNLLTSINGLVTTPDITNMLAGIRPTLDQYRELGAKLTSRVEPLADNVTNSLAEANRTLTELRGAAENLRSMLAPTSPLRHDLDLALGQIADAAHSVSALVDFLKQHPNALITGREVLPKKP